MWFSCQRLKPILGWHTPLHSIYAHFHTPRVCVVGSGPAGFYLTHRLVSKGINVDILERYPTPFGLVRYGVAPDHPEVKNVENTFINIASNPGVNFFGNVTLGKDVTLKELRSLYDGVVLAYGAAKDKKLNIPGEDLKQVLAARRFVGYYNGIPEDQDLQINLDCENVVVIGMGNVALDVARMLLTPIDTLRKTDITEAALELLSKSRVKNVVILGRRGPLQVAFTIKELREMVKLKNCRPVLNQDDFVGVKDVIKDIQRPRKRLTELLIKTAFDQTGITNLKAEKSWTLKLLRTPKRMIPDKDGFLEGIRLEINKLVGDTMTEDQKIISTGEFETIDCKLALVSVGYESIKVDPDIPLDEKTGTVLNVNGKVIGEEGLYCSGWLATGPKGVIVNTMNDSFVVGDTIINDLQTSPQKNNSETIKLGTEALLSLLNKRERKVVTFKDWLKLDKREKEFGQKVGKVREKITSVPDQLSVIEESCDPK